MNRYLSFIFIFTTLFSQKYDDKKIKLGDRGDYYKVWIYFEDKIDNETVIPEGKPGAGHQPWTFIDEIIIELL